MYDREALISLIRHKALKFGEFTLASGKKAGYYLDGKQVTLDPVGARLVAEGILKLLQDLQNDLGVSYLFITHDLATVKAISDEIIVMLEGRIVEQGAKQEILKPPHHEYTELLLSSVPEMDPDWLDNLLEERRTAA